LTKEQI
jgi:molecular chaperone DnaK (HSP70)